MTGSHQQPQRERLTTLTRTISRPTIRSSRRRGRYHRVGPRAARPRADRRPTGVARAGRAGPSERLAPSRGVRSGGRHHRAARSRRDQRYLCQRCAIARCASPHPGGPHRYRSIRTDVRRHRAHQGLARRQCRAAGARCQLRRAGQRSAATYPARCQPAHQPVRAHRHHRCQRIRQVHADEHHGRSGASERRRGAAQ